MLSKLTVIDHKLNEKKNWTQNLFVQKGKKWTPSTSKHVSSLYFFNLSSRKMMFNKTSFKITSKKIKS